MRKIQRNSGFTLVELSIVLVIIGLIVAGVVAGQSIVEQAKIRSVMSDVDKYRTALNTFKLQYDALPGDMEDATSFWTTADGDGDGNIEYGSGAANESWRAWQHLTLSSIIPGTYTGTQGSGGTTDSEIGVNTPAGPLTSSGYYLNYGDNSEALEVSLNGENFIGFGAARSNQLNDTRILSPRDAQNIDTKTDDGSPLIGKARSAGGHNGTTFSTDCSTGSGSSATYDLDQETAQCIMGFIF